MVVEIGVVIVGLALLVLGFTGWWRLSGQLTPEEKIADALHLYKRDVNRATYRTMLDLSRIRMEYGNHERKPVSERRQ
jgi:hypothetical protein